MSEGFAWRDWLGEMAWLLLPLLAALLVIVAHFVARWQMSRRSQALLRSFDESTRGRPVSLRPSPRIGFAMRIDPPPEPYQQLTVTYSPMSSLDPLGRLLSPAHQDRLEIRGELPQRPSQELQWRRGEIPGRALGHVPSTQLWTPRYLDFLQSEYATRGANCGALVNAFSELQRRFDPFLSEFTILAEHEPHMTLVMRTACLNPGTVPALVALVRAAGRAALLP